MENDPWFPDDYDPCDDCPYWDYEVGCTASTCIADEGGEWDG